jgi:ribonuclease P protein component
MRIPTLRAADYAKAMATRPIQSHAWLRLHRVVSGAPEARLGMILSKKITRTGVLRNALKRQIRVAFSEFCLAKQPAAADYVVRLVKIDKPCTKVWEQRFGRAVRQMLFKPEPSHTP